jgi:hypothetical protein
MTAQLSPSILLQLEETVAKIHVLDAEVRCFMQKKCYPKKMSFIKNASLALNANVHSIQHYAMTLQMAKYFADYVTVKTLVQRDMGSVGQGRCPH